MKHLILIGLLLSSAAFADVINLPIMVVTPEVAVVQPTVRDQAAFLITDENNTPIVDVLGSMVDQSTTGKLPESNLTKGK